MKRRPSETGGDTDEWREVPLKRGRGKEGKIIYRSLAALHRRMCHFSAQWLPGEWRKDFEVGLLGTKRRNFKREVLKMKFASCKAGCAYLRTKMPRKCTWACSKGHVVKCKTFFSYVFDELRRRHPGDDEEVSVRGM